MSEVPTETLDTLNEANDQEEWGEDDYEDDDDDDIDAEAEEIARRLGAELWADLSKGNPAQAANANILPASTEAGSAIDSFAVPSATTTSPSRKGDAVIITMRAILTFVENDPLARSTLASTVIPNSDGKNVLDTLSQVVTSGIIPKNITMPLSNVLVSLARSEVLFGTLRHSNASSIQLDKGKRKREEDELYPNDPRAAKRHCAPETDLHTQVTEAVRVVTHAFGASPTQPLDSRLVSSIRLQLHQVFLFAVTSSAGGGRDMHALQEISGLIQVIGVLSGIQIGQTPDSHPQHPHTYPPNSAYPWLPAQPPTAISTDIGTAVYPCLIAGCRKTFSRLYSLRGHQRAHAMHRPHRCSACPASFARNHDLKRHIKLHDKKAWKCGGCLKVFSRRDAIKRHKNGGKNRGPRNEVCLSAEIVEVELTDGEGEESIREERRAKLWNGIATNSNMLPPQTGYRDDSVIEEGEVQPAVISRIQSAVMSLHGLLQAHVGNALGSPLGQTISPPVDPTGGQATLASVIARAQLQNMPPKTMPDPVISQPDTTSQPPSSNTDQPSQNQIEAPPVTGVDSGDSSNSPVLPSLSMYGLSDEQTKMLEEAIANAASAAQAQAEAEAALEEEEEDDDDDDYDGSEGQPDTEQPQV